MSDEPRSPYQYHLIYQLEPKPEGLTKDQVPAGHGACDAAFILSCLFPPDGSFSLQIMSLDGRDATQLDDRQLFKVWSMMAKRLADSETIGSARKDFAATVFKTICQAITAREA